MFVNVLSEKIALIFIRWKIFRRETFLGKNSERSKYQFRSETTKKKIVQHTFLTNRRFVWLYNLFWSILKTFRLSILSIFLFLVTQTKSDSDLSECTNTYSHISVPKKKKNNRCRWFDRSFKHVWIIFNEPRVLSSPTTNQYCVNCYRLITLLI